MHAAHLCRPVPTKLPTILCLMAARAMPLQLIKAPGGAVLSSLAGAEAWLTSRGIAADRKLLASLFNQVGHDES